MKTPDTCPVCLNLLIDCTCGQDDERLTAAQQRHEIERDYWRRQLTHPDSPASRIWRNVTVVLAREGDGS